MTKDTEKDINLAEFKEEVLAAYPKKVAKKRAKGIVYNNPDEIPQIQANVRTIPGIITQRGCTYAGCKGVVLGPTRDIVNITHGPIGCGFYSWLTRRNQTRPDEQAPENFIPYAFSTDMQDSNIVFGGEEKLKQAIREAYELFHPKAIAIFSTCPVGLIGDDVHRVARHMTEELEGKVNIFGFSCEGYRGVSQSAGHHIANNGLYKNLIGNDDSVDGKYKFRINVLGEYNIRDNQAFLLKELERAIAKTTSTGRGLFQTKVGTLGLSTKFVETMYQNTLATVYCSEFSRHYTSKFNKETTSKWPVNNDVRVMV